MIGGLVGFFASRKVELSAGQREWHFLSAGRRSGLWRRLGRAGGNRAVEGIQLPGYVISRIMAAVSTRSERMPATLEERVKELERQVARLREQQAAQAAATGGRQWLDDLYGAFAGDAVFERAMKLGRDYRKSLRPRTTGSRRKSRS